MRKAAQVGFVLINKKAVMLTFPIGVFIWLQLNSYKIISYVAIYVATTVHDRAGRSS